MISLLDGEALKHWEDIVAGTNIQHVPIEFVSKIRFTMHDGTTEIFNVQEMVNEGLKTREILSLLNTFTKTYDKEIDELDYHINISEVASEVSELTRKLLGD